MVNNLCSHRATSVHAAPQPSSRARRPSRPRSSARSHSAGCSAGGSRRRRRQRRRSTSPDELEEYFAEPEETDLEIKVLAWWQAKESKWPALAKMVKQYFAAPASLAGVERVFSAAGKMHGDLQKSAKDSTLEHSLFTAFNTD